MKNRKESCIKKIQIHFSHKLFRNCRSLITPIYNSIKTLSTYKTTCITYYHVLA